jgi:hypothetical protein
VFKVMNQELGRTPVPLPTDPWCFSKPSAKQAEQKHMLFEWFAGKGKGPGVTSVKGPAFATLRSDRAPGTGGGGYVKLLLGLKEEKAATTGR